MENNSDKKILNNNNLKTEVKALKKSNINKVLYTNNSNNKFINSTNNRNEKELENLINEIEQEANNNNEKKK